MIGMDELVWLAHPETGGLAQFPIAAAEAWQARGWVPAEPPPVIDLALVGHVPLSAPEPPEPVEKPAKSARKPSDVEE